MLGNYFFQKMLEAMFPVLFIGLTSICVLIDLNWSIVRFTRMFSFLYFLALIGPFWCLLVPCIAKWSWCYGFVVMACNCPLLFNHLLVTIGLACRDSFLLSMSTCLFSCCDLLSSLQLLDLLACCRFG